MATAAASDVACKLVQAGTLELKNDTEYRTDWRSLEYWRTLVGRFTRKALADQDTWYTGLVVLSQDKIIVVDYNVCKVRLHSLQDGHLLAVYRTESNPCDICVCNEDETQMAVCLNTGQIEILSVKFTNKTTKITRMETLNLRTGFDGCIGVKYFNKKLMVSGVKEDNLCWGVVSITDGHIETFHKICKHGKYGASFLCTNNNDMVFISCWAGDENPDKTGVYGYRNSRREFLYQHKDLNIPTGVTMDRRHVYVCNEIPPCIHEMTESGQPLTIHTQGIQPSSGLMAIHWNQQDGLLYVTYLDSNVITRFRPEYSDHQDPFMPAEVLKMDTRSLDMFKEALRGGKEKVYNIRVMIVGQYGVGKTTLMKRLLGNDVNISERKSTEGIDVHIKCSKVSLSSGEWTAQEKSSEQDYRLQRLAKVLNEEQSLRDRAADEETCLNSPQREKTPDGTAGITDEEHVTSLQGKGVIDTNDEAHVAVEDKDAEVMYQGIGKNLSSTASHQEEFPSAVEQRKPSQSDTFTVARSQPSENITSGSQKIDPMAELIQLLQDNADKLKQDASKNSPVSVWDFAGQYSFYTTHQTFLSRRAIYLLVLDVSGHITDLVDDECYFDSEGMMKYRVFELIEVWLNSIHSCASSPEAGIPPVILVGTHVDKISQINRHEICERYFSEIRTYLSDKPTRFHLVDEDFAIDNTVVDSRLEDLKRKIVEVASQQSSWAEEMPTRWIPLEQELMRLKAAGVKLITRSILENLNQAGAVQIATEELDLFLRFHHDIGTILYFSTEALKDKVVLDPQWMIDALKSLITAEIFVLRRATAVADKWFVFKKSGILSPELIDAIWTKKENPDFHDNKEHILLLMEKLNIISRPRSYGEDGKIKEEKVYLAPCMLCQATPKEIISPVSSPQMESTSIICFMCVGKFLPPPVFHRLIGACLTQWPIAKQESENLIFCGCCVFDLDLHHRLTVYLRGNVIFAHVTRMKVTGMSLSSELCIEAKNFIFENLSKIVENAGHSMEFELHIQCPNSDANSLQSLIAVSLLQKNEQVPCHSHKTSHILESKDLLKFWYEESQGTDEGNTGDIKAPDVLGSNKRQPPVTGETSTQTEVEAVKDQEEVGQDDADAPITQEHINHARLCNALTTVCSDALRKILLIQVPAPHTDIYQAILAMQAKLTRLNNDQHQLVFPDPKGHYTGTVDQFDISLLYTLIRNISSAPPPSNGWGNAPTDQPRDTTLGASVERIRLYRNSISGHSVDGKVSQQDFEDYWKMIEDVLNDIENVIGKQAYLLELEKRRNQVITPHEAHELRHTFREYRKQVEAEVYDISSSLKNALSKLEGLRGLKK